MAFLLLDYSNAYQSVHFPLPFIYILLIVGFPQVGLEHILLYLFLNAMGLFSFSKPGAAPPLPPPPGLRQTAARPQAPRPPAVAPSGPPGAFLVELLIYNGAPFKDQWSYWVRSHQDPDLGVLIHASGDVRSGFHFEIKRSHDFRATGNLLTKRIPMQWVGKEFFIEMTMFNFGKYKVDQTSKSRFVLIFLHWIFSQLLLINIVLSNAISRQTLNTGSRI